MVVPLLAGEAVLGAMAVWRSGGNPFEARELAFLEGLSRQAAIALQNARLFDETKEALERQTATAEVLQVISGSMADAQPVFDAILDSAAHLFGAQDLGICLVDDDGMVRRAASYAITADESHGPDLHAARRLSNVGRAVLDRPGRAACADAHAPEATPTACSRLRTAELVYRSIASAPMMWQGRGIGAI